MDDREFSSPVCYLDYDNYEVTAAKPTQPVFCTMCAAFIADLYANSGEKKETNLETLENGKKLDFVLDEGGWVYRTKENIIETAERGCPLCVVMFEGLGLEERDSLKAWRNSRVSYKGGDTFEFKGEVNCGGIQFRLVSPPFETNTVGEAEGKLYHGLMKCYLLNII